MGQIGYGLDRSAQGARLVALERQGTAYRWVGSVRIEPGESDDPAALLAERLKKAGLRPRRCLVGISGKEVVLRYTRVPRVEQWKLERLMEMEAGEYTSQSESQILHDYGILNVPSREIDRFLMIVAMAKDAELNEVF